MREGEEDVHDEGKRVTMEMKVKRVRMEMKEATARGWGGVGEIEEKERCSRGGERTVEEEPSWEGWEKLRKKRGNGCGWLRRW